ncbi:hypothetical protein PAEPH01_0238 [Pancytospora epiphaga]|nr:hypothetical protein PAEPH01_0238 [Pancytospora epiphaga]
MGLSELEREELVIQTLEELDSTFSTIKNNLRVMKTKIGKLSALNRRLVEDFEPWSRFFGVEINTHVSPLSELQMPSLNAKAVMDSPDITNLNVPKNPFIETNSLEFINRSILNGYKGAVESESSNTPVLNKSQFEKYETVIVNDSEDQEEPPKDFSFSVFPEIFRQEIELRALYDFVVEMKTVTVDEICKKFGETSPEKLEIFISLLCRKRFFIQTGNSLSINY